MFPRSDRDGTRFATSLSQLPAPRQWKFDVEAELFSAGHVAAMLEASMACRASASSGSSSAFRTQPRAGAHQDQTPDLLVHAEFAKAVSLFRVNFPYCDGTCWMAVHDAHKNAHEHSACNSGLCFSNARRCPWPITVVTPFSKLRETTLQNWYRKRRRCMHHRLHAPTSLKQKKKWMLISSLFGIRPNV